MCSASYCSGVRPAAAAARPIRYSSTARETASCFRLNSSLCNFSRRFLDLTSMSFSEIAFPSTVADTGGCWAAKRAAPPRDAIRISPQTAGTDLIRPCRVFLTKSLPSNSAGSTPCWLNQAIHSEIRYLAACDLGLPSCQRGAARIPMMRRALADILRDLGGLARGQQLLSQAHAGPNTGPDGRRQIRQRLMERIDRSGENALFEASHANQRPPSHQHDLPVSLRERLRGGQGILRVAFRVTKPATGYRQVREVA